MNGFRQPLPKLALGFALSFEIMKTEILKDGFEVDAKRLHVPLKVHGECKRCGAGMSRDYSRYPLEYPVCNKIVEHWIQCRACGTEHHFQAKVVFEIVAFGDSLSLD